MEKNQLVNIYLSILIMILKDFTYLKWLSRNGSISGRKIDKMFTLMNRALNPRNVTMQKIPALVIWVGVANANHSWRVKSVLPVYLALLDLL